MSCTVPGMVSGNTYDRARHHPHLRGAIVGTPRCPTAPAVALNVVSPQVCLVCSRTSDLAGSRIQDPVSVPSWTSACSAGVVGWRGHGSAGHC